MYKSGKYFITEVVPKLDIDVRYWHETRTNNRFAIITTFVSWYPIIIDNAKSRTFVEMPKSDYWCSGDTTVIWENCLMTYACDILVQIYNSWQRDIIY